MKRNRKPADEDNKILKCVYIEIVMTGVFALLYKNEKRLQLI